MFEYRVTKFDPSFRDADGAYRRDDWTSCSDVGKSFGGQVLTAESYRRVEDAYVATALRFWSEAGQPVLFVRGLERAEQVAISEGRALEEPMLTEVIRRVLREELWCRLEGDRCFLHFGYDYYMYVGVPDSCPESCSFAATAGLFVETFVSPYHPRSEP